MGAQEPYRDENASLVAENERLRAELERLERLRAPRRRATTALALVASDAAVVLLFRPWFNGGSDAKFWIAVGVSLVLTLGTIAYAADAAGRRA
ncbi:MAG TPA: hypothetical protein VGI39_25600 [Polyangiaceae bacterium]|jgi:hypothetical protein